MPRRPGWATAEAGELLADGAVALLEELVEDLAGPGQARAEVAATV